VARTGKEKVSTKIYYGFRSHERALDASITWLRIAVWRNVIHAARWAETTEDIRSFVDGTAEAGIHIWHDSQKSAVLYCLFGIPGFLSPLPKLPSFLREYSYWNNTDAPEGISQRRWSERKRTWNRVAISGRRWDDRMTNVIFREGVYGVAALSEELLPAYRKAWGIKEEWLLSRQPLPTSPRR
jgi:hypothetical protein